MCQWTLLFKLGLATYCTLTDSFRRLKRRGRRCEIRHARRVCLVFSGAEQPFPRLERQMAVLMTVSVLLELTWHDLQFFIGNVVNN